MSYYSHEYYLQTRDKTRAERIANARKWALANPEKFRINVRKAVMKKRQLLRDAKNKPCADCGIKYPYWIMEFDHRNPAEKKFKVSRIEGCSTSNLLLEIAKCDVVCANCHAERTHKQCIAGLIAPYKKGKK